MKTKLQKKEVVAESTIFFQFEKPEGFSYEAGQSIDLTIPNPPKTDEKGNTRPFTLSSHPAEPFLSITTRIRDSAFKKVLESLSEGSELSFEGPLGDLTLHENAKRPAVFIAGGIGVTPARSIVAEATEKRMPHELILLYSNRRPEDAPFVEEFQELSKKNENFIFIPTMTAMEKSKMVWNGLIGTINEEMIKKYARLNESPVFYLAGPVGMALAMKVLLTSLGVSKDDIKIEEFSGYV
jgi:ferredoxin-NADP reductase